MLLEKLAFPPSFSSSTLVRLVAKTGGSLLSDFR